MCHYKNVKNMEKSKKVAQVVDMEAQFVHLARLALAGRTNDVELLSKRMLNRLSDSRPDLSNEIRNVLKESAAAPRDRSY